MVHIIMLRNEFHEQLKQAMHAKDEISSSTLRLIIAAMKDRDIAERSKGNQDGITEDQILSMLQTMIKQRHESIKMYDTGNRKDLSDREAAEIKVIERFLPTQLSEDEIKATIENVVTELNANGLKDMGCVIAEMKSKYSGQIDFSKASLWVKERLTGG